MCNSRYAIQRQYFPTTHAQGRDFPEKNNNNDKFKGFKTVGILTNAFEALPWQQVNLTS